MRRKVLKEENSYALSTSSTFQPRLCSISTHSGSAAKMLSGVSERCESNIIFKQQHLTTTSEKVKRDPRRLSSLSSWDFFWTQSSQRRSSREASSAFIHQCQSSVSLPFFNPPSMERLATSTLGNAARSQYSFQSVHGLLMQLASVMR